jgi:hypothetical protein
MKTQATCPVEAIARELAEVLARAETLQDDREGSREIEQLWDMQDTFTAQAQWLTPKSARGATLTAVLLLHLFRELSAEEEDGRGGGDEHRRLARDVVRLGDRLIDYLAAEAGATVDEQGLGPIHLAPVSPRRRLRALVA